MLFHELLSCPCNWFNAHGVKRLIKCHRGAPLSLLPSLSLGIGCIVTERGKCMCMHSIVWAMWGKDELLCEYCWQILWGLVHLRWADHLFALLPLFGGFPLFGWAQLHAGEQQQPDHQLQSRSHHGAWNRDKFLVFILSIKHSRSESVRPHPSQVTEWTNCWLLGCNSGGRSLQQQYHHSSAWKKIIFHYKKCLSWSFLFWKKDKYVLCSRFIICLNNLAGFSLTTLARGNDWRGEMFGARRAYCCRQLETGDEEGAEAEMLMSSWLGGVAWRGTAGGLLMEGVQRAAGRWVIAERQDNGE